MQTRSRPGNAANREVGTCGYNVDRIDNKQETLMRKKLNLEPDLENGVVPISKAASSLAAQIKKARSTERPVAITQKGYPTGMLLDIKLGEALRQLGREHPQQLAEIMARNAAAAQPEEKPAKPDRTKAKKKSPGGA